MSARLARLLSVALIAVCASPVWAGTPPTTKHTTLIWRGDVATAHAVVNEVAKAWQRTGHGRIELQPFNTASGIDAVASGKADLAGAARPSDGSALNDRLTFTPVAWDALVLITNKSNPVRGLTLKQVHDIYYGKIHNWSEVGGRNAPINVYAVASPGDGVEYSLRSLLFGRGNQPVAAPRLYVNTHKLVAGVALNPNGFGVATLTGTRGKSKIKALSINGKAPTVANIADGSYPLYIPLYLVTNPASPKAAQTQAFIEFLQTAPAEAAMRKHAVLPYQDGSALAARNDDRRSTILAAVGARPRHRAPISAPGATYASRVAVAPTSPDTVAAKAALRDRREKAADDARLRRVSGSVSAMEVSSVAHANGSATTVSKAANTPFNQVTASARQTRANASYTVVSGDTLSRIAQRHSVTVSQLRQWNNLSGNQIHPGQVLHLSHR